MKDKNILLTGSGGFIGKHLKEYLKNKYNILSPRSHELNLLDNTAVDIYLKNNNIDFIIHSAACGVRIMPETTLDETAKPNIKMFYNISRKNIPMITIGSGAEYDKSEPIINIEESEFGKRIPKDPYGYSKYIISKEIEKRENILNLRLFGVYGIDEDKTRVTSCIINDNLHRKSITLNQNVRFHFIWIYDFCKIVDFFIKNFPKEKFINITPAESIEIIELAEIINNISDYKSKIVLKKTGLNKEYTGSNKLLSKLIPDFKFTTYKDGLSEMYKQMEKKYNGL